MNTFTLITSWITIFSCSVTHCQPIYIYIFLPYHFQSPGADFSANQKQTQFDVPRQTHLAAQTPVCRGVIDSTAPEHCERHNQALSQESTLRNVNQLHQHSGGKPENIQEEGKLSHASAVHRPTPPPCPRQAVGRKRSDCLWDQKHASLSFSLSFRMIKIRFTSACM